MMMMRQDILTQFLILLLCAVTTTRTSITSTPTSVNATLGSTATFTCNISGGSIAWIVNGSPLTKLNVTDITSNGTGETYMLYIPATKKHNNTNVTCAIAILGGKDLYSDPVVLKVQGLLSSVSNLTAMSRPSSILLIWIPPFSLDITGVDPDFCYCIEVYNITSVNTTNGTTELLSTNCSVYSPEFTYSLNHPDPCDEFEFRVTPVNGAGNGSTSEPVIGYFRSAPESVSQVDVVVAVVGELEFMVNISFTLDICIGNNATFFQVYADEQQLQLDPDSIDLKYIDGQLMVVITVTFSDQYLNQIFSLLVEAGNTVGSSNSTGSTLLNTNDVQTVSAGSLQPGTVNISCTFATNSLARGFLAVIIQTQPSVPSVIFSVALRDNSSSEADMVVRGLTAGTYNAVVFDIEKNGVPGIPNTLAAGAETVNVSSGPQFRTAPTTSGTAAVRVAGNGSVCVTCTFDAFSDAMGCVALFLAKNNTMKLLVRSITKHPNESSVDMCLDEQHGVYIVAVFERQSNGVISNDPTVVSQITVTVIPQATGTPLPTSVPNPTSENNTLVIIAVLVLCTAGIASVGLGLITVVVFKRKAKKKAERTLIMHPTPACIEPDATLIMETERHYADLNISQAAVLIPVDRELELVKYAELDVKLLQPRSSTESGCETSSPAPSEWRRSLNVDNLFAELYPVTSKWEKLGEALGLDEDRLDEIFTNNQSEEECLRDMLEVWFKKSYKPTWWKVANALHAIGENQLAEQLSLMGDPREMYTFRQSDFMHASLEEFQETQEDNPGVLLETTPMISVETSVTGRTPGDPR